MSFMDIVRGNQPTDKLTGLLNRIPFMDGVQQAMENAKSESTSMTFACIDVRRLDKMKRSDRKKIISWLGATLRNDQRLAKLSCHYYENKFVLLTPHAGPDEALIQLQEFYEYLKHQLYISEYPLTLTVAVIGFLRIPSSIHEILQEMEELLTIARTSYSNKLLFKIIPKYQSELLNYQGGVPLIGMDHIKEVSR